MVVCVCVNHHHHQAFVSHQTTKPALHWFCESVGCCCFQYYLTLCIWSSSCHHTLTYLMYVSCCCCCCRRCSFRVPMSFGVLLFCFVPGLVAVNTVDFVVFSRQSLRTLVRTLLGGSVVANPKKKPKKEKRKAAAAAAAAATNSNESDADADADGDAAQQATAQRVPSEPTKSLPRQRSSWQHRQYVKLLSTCLPPFRMFVLLSTMATTLGTLFKNGPT